MIAKQADISRLPVLLFIGEKLLVFRLDFLGDKGGFGNLGLQILNLYG